MFNRSRILPLVRLFAVCLITSAVPGRTVFAQETKPLADAGLVSSLRIKPTSGQVTVNASADGLDFTIQPGEAGYPGATISPADGSSWDLSAFGHIDARIVNTGDKPLNLSLRVDNAGNWKDNPWNTESASIKPGEIKTITVVFGHSNGGKPGFALNPAAVKQVMLFTGKADTERSFRVESIQAAGPAGEKPQQQEEKPKPQVADTVPTNGVIFDKGTPTDASLTIRAVGGQIAAKDGALHIDFAAGGKAHRAAVRPKTGRWNLRDYLEVRVTLTNLGQAPVSPRVQMESAKGHTDWITTDQPIAPGQSAEVVVPFAGLTIWQGPKDPLEGENLKGSQGTRFASNTVSGIAIEAEPLNEAQQLRIDAIIASLPEAQLPEWLGQRPPVEGDWVQTFVEEFDSSQLDPAKWSVYGSNFWDKKSHFSKNNVILTPGSGVVRLRYEKKFGYHNDDPEHPRASDYATGYLHTYDKWTQLYGYFEARMKLPTAPGLWPAFWMMPDRGVEGDEQWKRQDTAKSGMEFDIMEHLTRWGPNRYTIAMHWDGYGKNHKATGAAVYARPDQDGYITAGLLWEPGLVVYYCNGKEVARWEHERISDVPSDLMFTLPTGGWDNDPLDDVKLPDDFIIDYVRCWQRRERVTQ